ncbi:hypothetical protein TYRP_016626 [Tyrophagus putrescentiae]|nr:hypothetical protein TYRP_016626 [Tyrophagus putrescentiae]
MPSAKSASSCGSGQPALGPESCRHKCPACHANVMTSTKSVPGTLTWILCIVLVLIGCICGCCLIPFYMDDCLDVEHRCPSCDAYLGKHVRVGN